MESQEEPQDMDILECNGWTRLRQKHFLNVKKNVGISPLN